MKEQIALVQMHINSIPSWMLMRKSGLSFVSVGNYFKSSSLLNWITFFPPHKTGLKP